MCLHCYSLVYIQDVDECSRPCNAGPWLLHVPQVEAVHGSFQKSVSSCCCSSCKSGFIFVVVVSALLMRLKRARSDEDIALGGQPSRLRVAMCRMLDAKKEAEVSKNTAFLLLQCFASVPFSGPLTLAGMRRRGAVVGGLMCCVCWVLWRNRVRVQGRRNVFLPSAKRERRALPSKFKIWCSSDF